MSEYQYIAFRAIDAPVTKENLAYMRAQSTRAQITRWRFDNEYTYGEFRGNAQEMLRRGYDFHLHYANFGIRALFLRLPYGFPDPRAAKPYLGNHRLGYLKDKNGPGGILAIDPHHEPGDLDELWDFEPLVDRLIPLRAEILAGDLRPLYLAHLAVSRDAEHDPDDATEGPVPAGLAQLTRAQRALAKLYQFKKPFLAAAAEASPPLPAQEDGQASIAPWIAGQPESVKNDWLAQFIDGAAASVRARMMTDFRRSRPPAPWPTVPRDRAISQLWEAARRRRRDVKLQAAAKAEELRRQRLTAIAADPEATLGQLDQLIAKRQTVAYDQAAQLLADVRDALVPGGQAHIAARRAVAIKAAYPTLRNLTAALRRHGFLLK